LCQPFHKANQYVIAYLLSFKSLSGILPEATRITTNDKSKKCLITPGLLAQFERRPGQIFGSSGFLKSTAHPEITDIIRALGGFLIEDSRVGGLVKLNTTQFTGT